MKEKCSKCNKSMEMYYKPWCPRCDKPEVNAIKSLNMIQVLRYLDIKRPGLKNRMMVHLQEWYEYRNDSSFHFQPYLYLDDLEDLSEDLQKDYDLLLQEFPDVEDGILFHVSW